MCILWEYKPNFGHFFSTFSPAQDRCDTTNRLAAHANENGPVTGGCPISSMVMVNIHGQHLYRELNYILLSI